MKKTFVVVSLLVSAFLLLTACGPAATPVPTMAPEMTEAPTTAPVENPLGTAAMPIVIGFAPSMDTQTLTTGGEALAAALKTETGYEFDVTVPTSYAALVEAMGAGEVQVGWLPPTAYIVANAKGYATAAIAAFRYGSDHYAFQFFANKEAGFTSYFDPATGEDTADAATALAQFAGKRPCFTEPLSTSGFLAPSGVLATNNISYLDPVLAQAHDKVAISVYMSPAGQICDFGATYVPMPNISATFPDYLDVLETIWLSDPIIPNDNISYATSMPADMQQTITDAFMKIIGTEDGLALLKSIGYSWQSGTVVDDSFYDEFRVALQAMGFDFNNVP